MKKQVEKQLKHINEYLITLFKWLACAVLTGLVCGLVGTAFHYAVSYATQIRMASPWLLYLLPIAGVLIVLSYHACGLKNNEGTNLVIRSIRTENKIPILMAPLIFVGTALTHLCGGSAGREGAALQIGGSLGAFLGNVLHLHEKDLHVITMCGMSALFAALFGTPIAAAVFCMEVISVGVVYYVAFLPCVISSIVAVAIATSFGIRAETYAIAALPVLNLGVLWRVIVIAIACALVSILFIIALHRAEELFHKRIPNQYLRVIAGGVAIILLTLLVRSRDYNGAGMDVISAAMRGQVVPYAFLLKIVFTALTIGAGFKGGEIVPTFFIGSTLGCTLGLLLGMDPGFAAALGLVGMFCGVVNCPLASMLLSIELFGSDSLPLFALVCAISYLLSGYYSLYASQKIVYSKLQTEYINKDTH